jgi:predicted Zn-dependent peptidase
MSDSVQCSISAGLPLFNIVHPSYKKFMLLNTVFGAYFGSRLMSNLREKNGFTYGASSMIQTFNKGGILIINTDVGKEVAYQAIEEIKNEINKIRNEKIGDEELQKVKNYFGGSISRGFDSVFSVADKIKRLAKHNLTLDFYDEMLEETKHTNAEDLLQLAQNHLSVDKLVISIAGAMDQLS